MPKMKTNKQAKKKFRVTGKGKVKRAQANMSHNTAKKSAKRKRHLRDMKYVDSANMKHIKRQLASSF